ncbi:hypothetical protein [Rhizobium ruizarguesonis]|uniref:hypothetical protein n=1 Tax=Rhizobium ruizarguesonis TaxID=2081791 RepID=UPI001030E5F0|nr:hypothetical protein [Rhizobium ruizarguesonis]TAZ68227.1 hypothetical protein ELH68_32545 [Rhizobium ruizarguesonis]TAZ92257.1 hypothetical protein ELH64_25615 [Rhizobium ruizarguesonis]
MGEVGRTSDEKQLPFQHAPQSDDLILWKTYRIDLAAELDRISIEEAVKTKITNLLSSTAEPKAWEHLYEAEQRLAAVRSDDAVKADWARRIVEAENLGVGSAAALKAQFGAIDTAENRKGTYLALLDDLHFRYAKRRLDRHTRMKTATWLNNVGVLLCALGLLFTVVGWVFCLSFGDFLARTHLLYAIWCGMLGAYFSRSVSMRSSIATLDYDVLMTDYSRWSVIQRLVIGAIAAFVMYLLIAGNLLAGDLFPATDFSKPVVNPKPGDPSLAIPSIAFAKLLVWSVIAGFSERLLPDQLSRLENSAQASSGDKRPPTK